MNKIQWLWRHMREYTCIQYNDFNLMYMKRFEDINGIIRSRKSKDIQNNGQKKKHKMTNNDLQNITQKTKVRSTWTGSEPRCSERVSSSCSTYDIWKQYNELTPRSWINIYAHLDVTKRISYLMEAGI
jgi:hypothetical protein